MDKYQDVRQGLWSKRKLALKFGIPEKQIKDIEHTELYQRTKPQRKKARAKLYHQIITYPKRNGRSWNFQGDILEFYSRDKARVQHNYGFKFILMYIDAYSRFLWAFPMKRKNLENIYANTKRLIEAHPVSNITFDEESGIKSRKITALFKKHNVRLWHPEKFQPGGKMSTALIERMNKTARNLIGKVEMLHPNLPTINFIPDIVDNYNSTPHMGLKYGKGRKWHYRTPKDVFQKQDYKQVLRDVPEIEVGELVRIMEKRKLFGKGTTRWSKKLYTVVSRVRNKYKLSSEGVARRGLVGPQDIQVVHDVTHKLPERKELPEPESGEAYIPDSSELSD